jgi:hypothetical protein
MYYTTVRHPGEGRGKSFVKADGMMGVGNVSLVPAFAGMTA